jgi:hypothetical protein
MSIFVLFVLLSHLFYSFIDNFNSANIRLRIIQISTFSFRYSVNQQESIWNQVLSIKIQYKQQFRNSSSLTNLNLNSLTKFYSMNVTVHNCILSWSNGNPFFDYLYFNFEKNFFAFFDSFILWTWLSIILSLGPIQNILDPPIPLCNNLCHSSVPPIVMW